MPRLFAANVLGSVDICRFRTLRYAYKGTQHAKSAQKRILSRLSAANAVSKGRFWTNQVKCQQNLASQKVGAYSVEVWQIGNPQSAIRTPIIALADALAKLADDFRYEEISAIIQEAR